MVVLETVYVVTILCGYVFWYLKVLVILHIDDCVFVLFWDILLRKKSWILLHCQVC